MKLHHKERMMELFNKFKIDLILHGHTHITNTYRIKNYDYINSSGCVAPFTQKKSFCYSIPANIKHKLKIKNVTVII